MKIEIEIPNGYKAEWVNGVLTLIQDKKEDLRPVTERVKTFQDACKELGDNHPLVLQYNTLRDNGANGVDCADVAAYLKLRIICAALNEGWTPKPTEGGYWYYPWFWLYTQKEIDHMSKEERQNRRMMSTVDYQPDYTGFAFAYTALAPAHSPAAVGAHLCLKNSDLATYCGKQFIKQWANYYLIRK